MSDISEIQTREANRRPDYSDRYEASVAHTDTRSSEQLMRAVFEDAPFILRWFIIIGWRVVLGLRLGPLHTPDYIMGWPIATSTPEETNLVQSSVLLDARLTLKLANSVATWNSKVYYKHPVARPIWFLVSLVHRQIVPRLLKRAAKRSVSG